MSSKFCDSGLILEEEKHRTIPPPGRRLGSLCYAARKGIGKCSVLLTWLFMAAELEPRMK